MNIELVIIGILILFFISVIIWNFTNIKESFDNKIVEQTDLDTEKPEDNLDSKTEFHHTNLDSSFQLGNYLSCYFYNIGVAFLHGKNFKTKINKNKDMFTNYLPEKVAFDQSVQDAFISVGINDVSLQNELGKIDGKCISAWSIMTKERETFWKIMKPTINTILKDALEKSELEKLIDAPVIHYRCSDIPINKSEYYHFQKYSYFRDGLDMIQRKTGKKYDKVYICYCNTHISNEKNQESCDKYVGSLTEYLESLGYSVVMKCQSVNEDFATMFYAPAVISTTSSFFAGFFSDGVFISSIYDEKLNRQCDDCDDWLQSGYTLKHSQVDDYHKTAKVIDILRSENSII